MSVPKLRYLDLTAAVEEIRAELDDAWRRVMAKGVYILGEEVDAFEVEFGSYCGVSHCVGVASGLDALRLLLQALDVGPGDEVIVPAYTAVATWMAVTAVGATPVGADVEPESFNLDPDAVGRAITSRTRVIIAVHLFGRPCEIDALTQVAHDHGVVLIEDAAQAHGAIYKRRRAGGLARAAAFSFYPTKNLGAFGDGGAITTGDAELAERLRLLRAYGWRERSVSETFGVNSRLDELQAAFLRVRLRRLDRDLARRRALAAAYDAALCESVPDVVTARSRDDVASAWHIYAVCLSGRDAVRCRLAQKGIETLVHYDPLPHLTPAYRAAGWKAGTFPIAEALSQREVSLPFYPQLDGRGVSVVSAALEATLER